MLFLAAKAAGQAFTAADAALQPLLDVSAAANARTHRRDARRGPASRPRSRPRRSGWWSARRRAPRLASLNREAPRIAGSLRTLPIVRLRRLSSWSALRRGARSEVRPLLRLRRRGSLPGPPSRLLARRPWRTVGVSTVRWCCVLEEVAGPAGVDGGVWCLCPWSPSVRARGYAVVGSALRLSCQSLGSSGSASSASTPNTAWWTLRSGARLTNCSRASIPRANSRIERAIFPPTERFRSRAS